MPSDPSRRRALRGFASAVGMTALGGCLFGFGDTPAGALIITNRHDEEHTMTVTVVKASQDYDDTPGGTPTPTTTPIWERTDRFTVGAGEEIRRREFITEPGAFYIEGELESGVTGRGWIGLYEAADGVAEDTIYISIEEEGENVTVFGAADD